MAKAALVTGGAKRIGRTIALALAEESYDIALHHGTSAAEAEKTAGEIRQLGVECLTFRCDLAHEQEVLSLLPRVVGKMPGLEILVNNAAIFEKGKIAETEPDFYRRHLAINFTAPYFLSRDFARICKKGLIINLLDTRVASNDFDYAVYTITKKALAELTKISAREFAPDIRVNAIALGIILPPTGGDRHSFEKMALKIPLKKTGGLDCVVQSVKFILKNDFLTGQFIYLDGGENLK